MRREKGGGRKHRSKLQIKKRTAQWIPAATFPTFEAWDSNKEIWDDSCFPPPSPLGFLICEGQGQLHECVTWTTAQCPKCRGLGTWCSAVYFYPWALFRKWHGCDSGTWERTEEIHAAPCPPFPAVPGAHVHEPSTLGCVVRIKRSTRQWCHFYTILSGVTALMIHVEVYAFSFRSRTDLEERRHSCSKKYRGPRNPNLWFHTHSIFPILSKLYWK